GRHWALLYLTAVHTGFRSGELAALRVIHLELDASMPCVRLPGEHTKNGQDAIQPLRADLVKELKSWIAETGKQAVDKVFNMRAFTQVSKILRKDLEFAGIPYRDASGHYFDFHALRKCTGTYLRAKGIDPTVSKQYLRHSDIRLTMETYADAQLLGLQAAVQAIRSFTIMEQAPEIESASSPPSAC